LVFIREQPFRSSSGSLKALCALAHTARKNDDVCVTEEVHACLPGLRKLLLRVAPTITASGQTSVVVFNWTKRPSDVLRKRREGDAARRSAHAFPDHHLPDRPSLDGYTVAELSPDQVAKLLAKQKEG
jgi:hypothetical protein